MKKTLFTITLLTLLIPLVSAFSPSYYLNSPSEILNNEWFVFGGVVLVSFAIIYFALQKQLADNMGVNVTIALVLAVFIGAAVSQRTRFSGFFGADISSWMLIIAFVIAAAFLIVFVQKRFGVLGTLITLIFIWILTQARSAEEIFPYEMQSHALVEVWNIITSYVTLIILLIITFFFLVSPNLRKKFSKPK